MLFLFLFFPLQKCFFFFCTSKGKCEFLHAFPYEDFEGVRVWEEHLLFCSSSCTRGRVSPPPRSQHIGSISRELFKMSLNCAILTTDSNFFLIPRVACPLNTNLYLRSNFESVIINNLYYQSPEVASSNPKVWSRQFLFRFSELSGTHFLLGRRSEGRLPGSHPT